MSLRNWREIALGEALTQSKEKITLDDDTEYKQLTVSMHGKGVRLRQRVFGRDVKTKAQFVARQGQFVYSRIDARNGAVGIVPPELDGAIVTSDFPLFDVDADKVHPRFFNFYVGRSEFAELCAKASRGVTNRQRLKEQQLLSLKIRVPESLAEQRRIVTRIDELAARIAEAQALREEIASECETLCRSILCDQTDGKHALTPMKELLRLRALDVEVDKSATYHFAGVYSFGKGVFKGPTKLGADFSYTTLTRLRAGDFTYPKLMAWEGALGVVPPECDGLVVSPEFPVFEVNENRVLREVLEVYFRVPSVWQELAGASAGTNARRRRINPSNFLEFKMPVPPMAVQKRLREVKSRLAQMSPSRAETSAELDALLPALLDRAFKGEL
jgi:type I restriction enzyme, S subunit